MKKVFTEPAMKISRFAANNIMTTSGIIAGTPATADEVKETSAYISVAKEAFGF